MHFVFFFQWKTSLLTCIAFREISEVHFKGAKLISVNILPKKEPGTKLITVNILPRKEEAYNYALLKSVRALSGTTLNTP
jgi:hypothetical protein